MALEPQVEPMFHEDSYGYRPGRSALDALGVCRRRCWKAAWVIDLDIRTFFDTVDHDLLLKAVRHHTTERWILLYVERWLKAPLQHQDGTIEPRERGTPQGSPISPLLANLFLHYVLDTWMDREFPSVTFERYCDDVVVHCVTEKQARLVKDRISRRLAQCGLEMHPEKTRIVYCKDSNRKGSSEHEQFDFLGYTFRPRLVVNGAGVGFVSFAPAVSRQSVRAIGRTIRDLRINRRSDRTLEEFAAIINPLARGWDNYYGHFYRSELVPVLRRFNAYLVRWAMNKYKRLRNHPERARRWLVGVHRRQPELFYHWQAGLGPSGWTVGAR
jgi:RNA-directed DNA polymerase